MSIKKLKQNKFFLTLPSISFLPMFSVISCINNQVYATTDISNINNVFDHELKSKITNAVNSDESLQDIKNKKIIQITLAGKVNDNSFNQMTWEAISEFSRNVNIANNTYKETKAPDLAEIHRAYTNALEKGYDIWVLTGWSQESFFSSWISKEQNKRRFNEKNIKIVSIDWNVSPYVDSGHGLALNFRTQESSFLVGYVVSRFLANKYSGEENKNKRIINCSAGADASGSTNFNYGFLEGVRTWNNEQSSNDTKVSSNVYKSTSKVFLSTTYEANNVSTRNDFKLSITGEGTQIFEGSGPTIVMPVAGDWSKTAANIIKETNNFNNKWVVGVDSNMAISFGDTYKNYFITSSEKRIGIATYKALCFLTGISNVVNDQTLYLDIEDTDWEMKEGLIFNKTENKTLNWSIMGGVISGFVGASPSTLSNIQDANNFDKWIQEAEMKFFGNGTNNGELMIKPENQSKLDAFNEAKRNPGTNNSIYNQTLFELSNVLYGGMTTNNNGYFNLVVDEINKWNN
ncbi:MAG: BMP family ABC transporter substrate-binding protein [Mycoplasma sp.]|nr:BMP family ABC transporter substrate-binding protein [Mycoplasma sp.]